MDDKNTFTVADRTFRVSEPTFRQLDELKNFLGFDLAAGMKDEQSSELMNDMKKVSGVLAILAKDVVESSERRDALAEFFYENGTITIFRQALSFFTQSLRTASAGTSGHTKEAKDDTQNPARRSK